MGDSELDEVEKTCEGERKSGKVKLYQFTRDLIYAKTVLKHVQASISSGYIAKFVKRMGFSSRIFPWQSASQVHNVTVI